MSNRLKTCIAYYGGKQKLTGQLLSMIPPHRQYVEPFCGGAALFWAKAKKGHEVLNDHDLRIINFWQVVREDFDALQSLIASTLHHEYSYYQAKDILKAPMEDRLAYAWAFWVQSQMSFSNKLFGGFAFNSAKDVSASGVAARKRHSFQKHLSDRLSGVEIFCRDALELIRLKDREGTFFYFDPPYLDSSCGHYEKDKQKTFEDLLGILPSLKSRWLLSSYPSAELTAFRQKGGYKYIDIEQNLGVSGQHTAGRKKKECLTYNYILPSKNSLFG